MIVNAFTCTGAYAVLIMSGLKRVENRSSMPVPVRGRCAMSVSKKFCRKEYDGVKSWLTRFNGDRIDNLLPTQFSVAATLECGNCPRNSLPKLKSKLQ